MREISLLFIKGIKSKKSSFLGIFLLMLLMSMTLVSVITIRLNYKDRQAQAVKTDGYGNVVFWILDQTLSNYQMTADEIISSTKNNQAVDQVLSMPYIGSTVRAINGKKTNNSLMIQSTDHSLFSYTFFDADQKNIPENSIHLKEDEVAVPLSFVSAYHCKIGDKIEFGTENSTKPLVIKAFFEDPYMGSSVMGIKTILVNEHTFQQIKTLADSGKDEKVKMGTIVNVFQKNRQNQGYSDLSFVKKINKENQISSYSAFALTRQESTNYMLMLTNIFSGILVAFLVLLLMITVIIISHSIGNSIEMEFKDIGILKAIGIPAQQLQFAYLLQYAAVMSIGGIAGIFPAIPVISFVDSLTRPVINLAISQKIAGIPCLLLELVILCFLCFFTFLKLRTLKRIHPLQAIREGNTAIVFRSRMQLPIEKKFLSLSLAYRQLITGKKNYIGAMCITAILFFFLILVNGMAQWGGNGGANIIAMFSNYKSDFSIRYADQGSIEQVEQTIRQTGQWKDSFYGISQYMMVNGVQMQVTALSDPAKYNTVYEGRTCKYENEILITQYVADEFKKGIGDKIEVGKGNQKKTFMVSGIYQCANDVGANIAMSLEGMKYLQGKAQYAKSSEDTSRFSYEYQVKNSAQTNAVVRELKKTYSKDQITVESNQVGFSGMSAISSAIGSLSCLVYVIAGIFAMITISMVSGKIMKKEMKDYGIYKAIGYTSSRLRSQIALRMGIVALLGNFIGIGLFVLLGKGCIMLLLRFMGVYHYEMQVHLQSVVMVGLLLLVFFMLVTYLFTAKIKRVSTKMLMSE